MMNMNCSFEPSASGTGTGTETERVLILSVRLPGPVGADIQISSLRDASALQVFKIEPRKRLRLRLVLQSAGLPGWGCLAFGLWASGS